MKCIGSGEFYGQVREGSFRCPRCKAEWATSEIEDVYIPDHERQEQLAYPADEDED